MLYVCYRCEHIVTGPLVGEVALPFLGAIGDTSSLPQLLEVLCVVQLVACRPAPGFCTDPSSPLASSLERMVNSCFELWLHPPAAELVLQCKATTLLLLTGGMCILGETGRSVVTQWSVTGVCTQLGGLHQVAACGSSLVLVLCGWS